MEPLSSNSLPQTTQEDASPPAPDIAQLVEQMLAEGQKGIYCKLEVEVDRAILRAVLRHTKGNQVQASELLGISRTTLRTKLRNVRIAIEKQAFLKFNQVP
jgi:DNA-binding protein Fis